MRKHIIRRAIGTIGAGLALFLGGENVRGQTPQLPEPQEPVANSPLPDDQVTFTGEKYSSSAESDPLGSPRGGEGGNPRDDPTGAIWTEPEHPVWVADGETINRVYIRADNTGVSEDTVGTQVIVNAPGFMDHPTTGPEWYGWSTVSDFFQGFPKTSALYGINGINQWSDYWVHPASIPPGNSGNIYFYDLIVNAGAPTGETGVTIGPDSALKNINGVTQQPIDVLNENNIYVIDPPDGDIDGDGDRDIDDVSLFTHVLLGRDISSTHGVPPGDVPAYKARCDMSRDYQTDGGAFKVNGADIQPFVDAHLDE